MEGASEPQSGPAPPVEAALVPVATVPEEAGETHAPVLRRIRRQGQPQAPFRKGGLGPWVAAGIILLALTILAPLAMPQWAALTERVATLAALTFLSAAPGLAMGMGRRALVIAAAAVAIIYALSAWGGLAFQLEQTLHLGDLFLVALLASFGLFILAGFNLVLVLEEMVYDIHRLLLHPRNRAWLALPLAVVAALAFGLPRLEAIGGPHLPFLRLASLAGAILLAAWWLVRFAARIHGRDAIVRELHLLVFSVVAAGALADGIHYLQEASTLIPSIVAYLSLIGTWVYVNYTTLQRAHFLLKARDPSPWIAILLSASFAIVAHAYALYRASGHIAVEDLVGQRVGYMVVGVAAGVVFLVARGLWRGLDAMTQEARLPASARRAASHAGRVAGSILATEQKVEQATLLVFRTVDRILPGTSKPPQRVASKPWTQDGEAQPAEQASLRP